MTVFIGRYNEKQLLSLGKYKNLQWEKAGLDTLQGVEKVLGKGKADAVVETI